MRMKSRVLATLPALAALAAAQPAAAAIRTFSYDAANQATRQSAGDLTFQFRQRLIFTTVLNLRSSDGPATADLKPAGEGALGRGGLSRLIGSHAPERDLYEVGAKDQGPELIRAFCPGSRRAWLAFGRLSESAPLRIYVIGDNPAGGPTRLCRTLDFAFRGEWRLPPPRIVPVRDVPNIPRGPLG
jgi:hypothetical protein